MGCLREADIVIVLSHDGSMEAQGPFEAIIKQNEFMQGLSSQTESDNEEEEEEEAELEDDATARGIPTDQASSQPKPTKETTPRGNGDISLYGYYIQSFGWWPFGFVLASAVLFVLCLIFPRQYSSRDSSHKTQFLHQTQKFCFPGGPAHPPSKTTTILVPILASLLPPLPLSVFISGSF